MADVIMPALGMAQDTGKLVQWLKRPGDPVAVGDQLFEVETDKSVMEVEAQADGFLTAVSAADGDDVPVGQVIAVISDTADAPLTAPSSPAGPAKTVEPSPQPDASAPKDAPPGDSQSGFAKATPQPRSPQPAWPAGAEGRVLASPKMRRLAQEQGLDLATLARANHPQPYHVADLTVLRDLSKQTAPDKPVVPVSAKQITARVSSQGAQHFIDWMKTEGGISVTTSAMFTSFAAGAWRTACNASEVMVHIGQQQGQPATFRDPDFMRLSVPAPDAGDARPTFILHDLSESSLTSLRLGDLDTPTLCIGSDGTSFLLTFEFSGDGLSDEAAIGFITELAQRLEDPLHHLV